MIAKNNMKKQKGDMITLFIIFHSSLLKPGYYTLIIIVFMYNQKVNERRYVRIAYYCAERFYRIGNEISYPIKKTPRTVFSVYL